MTLFAGLSAFPITPATPDGQIIADDLVRMLLRLRSARVDSIGLLGSTGTYAYLDRSARRDAVCVATETLAGDVPLIVSVGALRTDAAVALAQDAGPSEDPDEKSHQQRARPRPVALHQPVPGMNTEQIGLQGSTNIASRAQSRYRPGIPGRQMTASSLDHGMRNAAWPRNQSIIQVTQRMLPNQAKASLDLAVTTNRPTGRIAWFRNG